MSDKSVELKLAAWSWGLHAAGALAAGGLVAAAVGLFFVPLTRDAAGVEQQVTVSEGFVQTAERIRTENADLKRRAAELETQMAGLMARIPDKPQESEFLANLATLAGETGLTIREYRPGVVTRKEKYDELEIELSAQANYESLCRFLSGMQSLSRLCQISQLEIKTDEDTGYSIDMELHVFFAPRCAPAPVEAAKQ
jgi:Tfp pilus assembly protein PilO